MELFSVDYQSYLISFLWNSLQIVFLFFSEKSKTISQILTTMLAAKVAKYCSTFTRVEYMKGTVEVPVEVLHMCKKINAEPPLVIFL